MTVNGSSCFHLDQQIKSATQKEYKEFKITPHRAWHFRSVPWQRTSVATPPLLSGRGSRHTSAPLTARSLTPRRCTAQHSCLLSVSSDLDLFLPQSLPALCLLSMIAIYLWPDVSLKVFCHNLKWTATARRWDLSTLGVRSGIIVTNGELLRSHFYLEKKIGNHVVLVWTLYLEGKASNYGWNKILFFLSATAWVTRINSSRLLFGPVSLKGHAKISCVSFSAERRHRVDTQQMNIKPWETKTCSERKPA